MKKLFKSDRAYENAHVFLWLLKDSSWCHAWRWLGVCMIVPTLLVQIHLCWKSRKHIHEILHNVAVAFWISANATWMLGEFFFNDGWRGFAQYFFDAGIALMLYYYIFLFHKDKGDEHASANG